jgi:hypothetical protein
MKHIQNNQKFTPSRWIQKISRKNPRTKRLLPNVCDFQEENHTLGYGFKNLKKIYS